MCLPGLPALSGWVRRLLCLWCGWFRCPFEGKQLVSFWLGAGAVCIVGIVVVGLVDLAGAWGGVGAFVVFAGFSPLPVTP